MYHGETLMTGSGSAPFIQGATAAIESPESGATETITSRFGEVTISRANPINFPTGMLGIPNKFAFCLTNFPNEKLANFTLLQSLDDVGLSFITMPLDVKQNDLIEPADLQKAAEDLGIPSDTLAALLVVSVHRSPSGEIRLSANLRAPILIDSERRNAHQHVFSSSKYNIRHMLGM